MTFDVDAFSADQVLDCVAEKLHRMTGRSCHDLRHGYVRSWGIRLTTVCSGDALMAARVLVVLVGSPDFAGWFPDVRLPDKCAGWSAETRIDALVDAIVRTFPNGVREKPRWC